MTLIEILNKEVELKTKLQVIENLLLKHAKADIESTVICEGLKALRKETEKELNNLHKKLGV